MRDLPIDAVPDVTNVQVQILTNSPGLAPQEVERFITFPVETAMSGLPRIEEIRSVSKFGLSVVTVVFEEGTDIYWGRQLVADALRSSLRRSEGRQTPGRSLFGVGTWTPTVLSTWATHSRSSIISFCVPPGLPARKPPMPMMTGG